GGGGDGVDGLVDLVARDRDLDLDLRQKAHRILGPAIDLGVALLTPVALDLGHGHPVHADRSQSVADLVELERLDDCHDDFHGSNPRLRPTPANAGCGHWPLCSCRAEVPPPDQATATNQAPCQFATAALSARKAEAFLGCAGGPCDCLASAA